jgi:hypothetical protein
METAIFCDNPKCLNHQVVDKRTFDYGVMEAVNYYGTKVMVDREVFVKSDGRTLNFCSWCKGAIDIFQSTL